MKPASRGSRSLILVTCVLASGCMVGPEYARPEVALAPNWTSSGDPRLATNATVDVAWWTNFHDPALDRLIELAYRQDLSLQIARLRIEQARAELGIAIGEMYPRGGPSASGTAGAIATSEDTGVYGRYLVGFDATWELDLWGRQRHGVRAARAALLAQVADYQDAVVSLNAEIARAYVLARTFELLIEQAVANADVQEQAAQIASSRFRHGATSELDVAQATALLETTRGSVPRLRIGHQQVLNALNTLLGRPRGFVEPILAEARGGIPSPPRNVAVGVPAELLRRRPDIRAAELRAIAQCNRVGVATAELYPSFSLTGFLGTPGVASAGADPGLAQAFGPGTLLYTFGGSLLWPLLNYPQIINNIESQDALYAQSLLEYARTVLVAAQEVEDGIVGFLFSGEAVGYSRNAVTAAELAVNLALIQYREGATDYMRVVDTQRVLLDAQTRLTESLSSNATNAISLYKALGGGWEIAREVVPESPGGETEQTTGGDATEQTPSSSPRSAEMP